MMPASAARPAASRMTIAVRWTDRSTKIRSTFRFSANAFRSIP
jgi:hypothetical protein